MWRNVPVLGLCGLDEVAVDIRPVFLDLDQDEAKPTLPDVAQAAPGGRAQIGLGTGASPGEGFWHDGGVHDGVVSGAPASGRCPGVAQMGSEPEPDSAKPPRHSAAPGAVVLAKRAVH